MTFLGAYPPFATVLLASLAAIAPWHRLSESKARALVLRLVFSIGFYALPPHSIITSFWQISSLAVTWMFYLLPFSWIRRGGPLGKGCGKFWEVIVGLALWTYSHNGEMPPYVTLGPWPSFTTWSGIALLSAIVNAVLQLWSHFGAPAHQGVVDMVNDTALRKLSWIEQLQLAGLAFINAVCEEVTSRGIWRSEYYQSAGLGAIESNLAQALAFGIWHYDGIPSGLVGIVLTFVYGGIMGLLADYCGGLLVPIATHAVADYYIFAIVVRQSIGKQKAA